MKKKGIKIGEEKLFVCYKSQKCKTIYINYEERTHTGIPDMTPIDVDNNLKN
jgi:hypothetical protein